MSEFKELRGDNPRAKESAAIVNYLQSITLTRIRRGHDEGMPMLYLGERQRIALGDVEQLTAMSLGINMLTPEFMGVDVVWVKLIDHARIY